MSDSNIEIVSPPNIISALFLVAPSRWASTKPQVYQVKKQAGKIFFFFSTFASTRIFFQQRQKKASTFASLKSKLSDLIA